MKFSVHRIPARLNVALTCSVHNDTLIMFTMIHRQSYDYRLVNSNNVAGPGFCNIQEPFLVSATKIETLQ